MNYKVQSQRVIHEAPLLYKGDDQKGGFTVQSTVTFLLAVISVGNTRK